jgi:hypothetical protein
MGKPVLGSSGIRRGVTTTPEGLVAFQARSATSVSLQGVRAKPGSVALADRGVPAIGRRWRR